MFAIHLHAIEIMTGAKGVNVYLYFIICGEFNSYQN